jgi:hypothetical protein
MPNLVRPIVEGKNRRVFRAYLAEEYDGIGQFVAVSLTRSGITSAFRAKISLGDVGNDVQYPVGTPVLVFSDHGLLEILSFGGPDPVSTRRACPLTHIVSVTGWGTNPPNNPNNIIDGSLSTYSDCTPATPGDPVWLIDLGYVQQVQSLRLLSTQYFLVDSTDSKVTFAVGKTIDEVQTPNVSWGYQFTKDEDVVIGFDSVLIPVGRYIMISTPTGFATSHIQLNEIQISKTCGQTDFMIDVGILSPLGIPIT